MYLSRIELYGFKSFAQRTVVDFSSGVTSVVGPNGCGKTNILDAVRWVLGEQRSSTLRSDRMESIIFNGSQHRRPLGMAEVTLTIENSRSILPLEYSEVQITRRLYRSGDSEYLLNRVPCRLKDITDLFMDTGMGAGSYSVIELKMVEDLLSDRPEERRHLFEEAAGVTKYKHRRRAALRKLEETRQNIERLQDVVSEASRQVNTLKRQVRRTERHREYALEQKEQDLLLAQAQYMDFHVSLEPLQKQIEMDETTNRDLVVCATQLEGKEATIVRQLVHAEQRQTDAEEALRERSNRLRALEEETLIGRERLLALSRDLERMEREKTDLEPQLFEGVQKLKALDEHLASSDRQQSDLDAAHVVAKEQADRAHQDREDALRLGEKVRARVLELLGNASRKESDFARVSSGLEAQKRQLEELDSTRSEARLRHDQNVKRTFEFEAEEGRIRSLLEASEQKLQECERNQKSSQSQHEERSQHLQSCLSNEKALQDRRSFLDRLVRRFEGVPGGARDVLKSGISGIVDSLGNLLHADELHLPAVEVALGEAATFVVTETREALKNALAFLEESSTGGCTFLVMGQLPSVEPLSPPFQGATPLIDCLKISERFRPLAFFLLKSYWLVDDLNLVPEGDWVGQTFLTRGGQLFKPPVLWHRAEKETSSSHLGLSFQLEQIDDDLETLSKRIEDARHQKEKSADLRRAAQKSLESIHEGLKQERLLLRQVEDRRQRLNFEQERFHADESRYLSREKELTERGKKDESLQKSLQEEIDHLRQERDSAEIDVRSATSKLNELSELANAKAQSENHTHLAARELRLRLEGDRQEQSRLRQFLEEGRARLQRNADHLLQGKAQSEESTLRQEELDKTQLVAREARQTEEKRLEEMRGESRSLVEAQKLVRRELNESHKEREALTEQIHKAELARTELKAQVKALSERLLAEYEIVLSLPDNDEQHETLQSLDQKMALNRVLELKEAIRRLGPVNLLAIEEYDRENERLEFLTVHLKDLLDAETMLKDMIVRINRVAGELFEETFQKIRTNFEYLFKKLFEDGRADLSLGGDDFLEGDVSISASPSGKRIQSISLMSGGEKTLTAIALLFAIYMVKPSPFCILDEVDAPLDDANIGRFNTIIQEFSGMTQFIIITHNKKTMGYADQLYGVTMAEEGVSSLVSVQFND